MYELVEIVIIVEKLRKYMLNETISNIKIYPISRYFDKTFQGFEYLFCFLDLNSKNVQYNLNGKITNIFNRGKLIFFEICVGDINLVLLFSITQNSKYFFNEPSVISIEFELEENKKLFFQDYSNRSQFKCLAYLDEYELAIRETGPDYTSIDFKYFKNKITFPRIKDVSIYEFLKNQKIISGLDRYLISETFFEIYANEKKNSLDSVGSLNPFNSIGYLNNNEILTIYNCIRKVLNKSYSCGGKINETYPDDTTGNYQCKIYGNDKIIIDEKYMDVMTNDRKNLYWVEN